MSRVDAHAREAPFENIVRAFAPRDDLPGLIGQFERQLLDRHGLMGLVAPQAQQGTGLCRPKA